VERYPTEVEFLEVGYHYFEERKSNFNLSKTLYWYIFVQFTMLTFENDQHHSLKTHISKMSILVVAQFPILIYKNSL